MHREFVSSTRDNGLSVAWISLGLVILLIAIVGISNLMYNRYGISYSGYITFVLYILIGVYVYRKRILKYCYSLTKSEIIFESIVGKRSREIIRIDLDRILYFCPLTHEVIDHNTAYKNRYITFDRRSPKAYVVAYREKDKIHRIIFEPSEKLVALIKDTKTVPD